MIRVEMALISIFWQYSVRKLGFSVFTEFTNHHLVNKLVWLLLWGITC